MTSSKGTCLLTNASIDTDDAIYIYIIQKTNNKECDSELIASPTHYYSPISFSIKAEYCEHFYIKNTQDSLFHLNYLKGNKDFMNYNNLEDLLVDIYTGSNGLNKYKLAFILKDVLLNTISRYELTDKESWIHELKKNLYNVSIEKVNYENNNILLEDIVTNNLCSKEMIQIINNSLKEKNFHKYKDCIYELHLLNILFYFLRKIWFPSIGLGNPYDNIDLHLQIMDELKILKNK